MRELEGRSWLPCYDDPLGTATAMNAPPREKIGSEPIVLLMSSCREEIRGLGKRLEVRHASTCRSPNGD